MDFSLRFIASSVTRYIFSSNKLISRSSKLLSFHFLSCDPEYKASSWQSVVKVQGVSPIIREGESSKLPGSWLQDGGHAQSNTGMRSRRAGITSILNVQSVRNEVVDCAVDTSCRSIGLDSSQGIVVHVVADNAVVRSIVDCIVESDTGTQHGRSDLGLFIIPEILQGGLILLEVGKGRRLTDLRHCV